MGKICPFDSVEECCSWTPLVVIGNIHVYIVITVTLHCGEINKGRILDLAVTMSKVNC
jgi:hypothetical protein